MDSGKRRIAAIIVAAGRGVRARDGDGSLPKQYRPIGGRPVLRRTLDALLADPRIGRVACVIHPDDADLYADIAPADPRLLAPVGGGRSRQESVQHGLERLAQESPDIVLVHDAVRPFVTGELIDRLLTNLQTADAAIPALPVTDTVKRVDAADTVLETVPRADLRAVQTPQAFRFAPLIDAHRRAARDDPDRFTDDASIAEWAGLTVATVPGDPMNKKLTTAADIAEADRQLSVMETRVGSGFDVHRFGPGSSVWLAGVEIPHDQALVGHSDADVGLHTLTDAIFGALADGDIGSHFPPSDAQYNGATSDRFLAFAAERVRERGGRILHLDLTLICERPKVGPHRDAMRARIAEIAGVSVARVAVKATTSERLGFTGRGEGIAATAVATLSLPAPATSDTPAPGGFA
ncbi:bifunctional 2-C-methyl-D-erythritol 4-phosphate cytidylyltransferase/2-C-methyl-D-erythritol 2,4-cyclodiphosphate synthase [Amorphus orientalis]|uniref:Bifunctional enzyme IspD/IspF n=1 Tax=Amorphus orientalis TaxID=649198 RepID=A0AAE4ATU9_9HYPH|nr:bifunctional 2-C-methyl-D-erythritol 4-phosphate cytidylyltransferase/2-C-methyl-D-erythritol 2,4-cyclodiphosphate synthase [Amorphus orientalis]MDQ0317651.1 2-C-methyl-D-erythritol 4-phosphate cytidylyltransferase/2-C-methyl-D-erythritol 2,4-cyclodiphosphate synthase [Amorphus orientalis]